MTEPDPSEPVVPGGDPRGVGESLDAPAADVPAVDDPPVEQAIDRSDTPDAGFAAGTPGAGPVPLVDPVQPPSAGVGTPPETGSASPVATATATASAAPTVPAPRPVVLRRAPRYRAFLLTGAGIGAVLGIVLTTVVPDRGGQFSTGTVLGYLAAVLALVGALVGGAVAVVLERRDRHP
jgi:hypothetical protein